MNMPPGDDNSHVVKSSAALLPSAGGTALQSNHNDQRLKVLVLDEEIPFPLNSGKRIRTWNLLRNLCRQHSITFLCYGTPENPGLPQTRLAFTRARSQIWFPYGRIPYRAIIPGISLAPSAVSLRRNPSIWCIASGLRMPAI